MSTQPSIADRLVGVMDMKRQIDVLTERLGTPGQDPRFAIDMAAGEVMNGVADALRNAFCILDRLRVLAERTNSGDAG